MQKKSYGHQLHFDSVDFRWDDNQYAYRKITLDDLIKSAKTKHDNTQYIKTRDKK